MPGLIEGWFQCPICNGEYDRSVMNKTMKKICLNCWKKEEEGEVSIHIDHTEIPRKSDRKPAMV
jgi:hypothetical protein